MKNFYVMIGKDSSLFNITINEEVHVITQNHEFTLEELTKYFNKFFLNEYNYNNYNYDISDIINEINDLLDLRNDVVEYYLKFVDGRIISLKRNSTRLK